MNTYKQYIDKAFIVNDKILFEENKPFSVKIKCIQRYPIHIHENVTEILLIIKGSLDVFTNHEHVCVNEGDFIFINNNSVHSLQSSEEAIVAAFYIDLNYYEKKYEHIKSMYFRNNMYSKNLSKIQSDNFDYEKKESKIMFKNKLIGILLNTVYNYELSDEIILLYEKQLIESMINEFNWLQFLNTNDINPNQLERYFRIVNYIQEHIYEKITLNDIESFENISKNYLSHFWKDISSFSFLDRVNFEKILKSVYILLYTDKNIASISEELEFSDVKYFYSHFKKWFGCTPLVFRKKCFTYMNLEMKHFIISDNDAEELFDDYLNYNSLSSYRSFNISTKDSYPLIKQFFSLDENYFLENTLSIVLDLFKYIKIEDKSIKINRNIIYQIILLTNAKNLGLTLKIDCENINNISFIDILNNFFNFSLFHFGKNIMETWAYFIKYNDNVTIDHINEIKKIIEDNVKNTTFKYYVEI